MEMVMRASVVGDIYMYIYPNSCIRAVNKTYIKHSLLLHEYGCAIMKVNQMVSR